ncbi:MAG: hypothetical protein JXN61_14440 [Sedimentisphaerales bacterium]|nr:hypothetical protein [Sedimentisphaerales bacterium]
MTKHGQFLKLFLRIIGSAGLLAVGAVVMPYSWMNAIHGWLGMGDLPSEPIVGYLARSASMFYALFGGLLWTVSFDLYRHRLVLCYLGAAVILFGAVLFAIDVVEGLPLYWILFEGPMNTAFGIVILVWSRRLKPALSRDSIV